MNNSVKTDWPGSIWGAFNIKGGISLPFGEWWLWAWVGLCLAVAPILWLSRMPPPPAFAAAPPPAKEQPKAAEKPNPKPLTLETAREASALIGKHTERQCEALKLGNQKFNNDMGADAGMLVGHKLHIIIERREATAKACKALKVEPPPNNPFTDAILDELGRLIVRRSFTFFDRRAPDYLKERGANELSKRVKPYARKVLEPMDNALVPIVVEKPKRVRPAPAPKERIINATCSRCRGTGKIGGSRSSYTGGSKGTVCPACKGTGKVKRIIRY